MARQSERPLGLEYIEGYISEIDESALMRAIDARPWAVSSNGRAQRYGDRYNNEIRSLHPDIHPEPLPAWLREFSQRMRNDGLTTETGDEVVIRELRPDQALAPRTNCEHRYSKATAWINLKSCCTMRMLHNYRDDVFEISMAPRSLLLLSSAARYRWCHGIVARDNENWNGLRIALSRCVSLTFRTVMPDALEAAASSAIARDLETSRSIAQPG